jgi:hypothetical protein
LLKSWGSRSEPRTRTPPQVSSQLFRRVFKVFNLNDQLNTLD